MTTLNQEELTCVMCGSKSEHTSIASTNSFGSPDLDLRPPEMQRSTMSYWVQECPECGYAYSSITEKADNSSITISSDAYKALLSGELSGSLLGRFAKASLIAEGAADISAAANYALNAAWAADDAHNKECAISYRNRAADLFQSILKNIDDESEESIITRTRLVDILRRAERWEESIEIANTLLNSNLDPTIRSVLEFEHSVASKRDPNCYTVEVAMKGK